MHSKFSIPVTVNGQKVNLTYEIGNNAIVTAYFTDETLNKEFGIIVFQVSNLKGDPSIEFNSPSITSIQGSNEIVLSAWLALKKHLFGNK